MEASPRIPIAGEYQEAIQHPDRCFSDPELRSASFERGAMGLPRVLSGNFACVFPMTGSAGRRYAVKCFTRGAPHQLQRYSIIGDYLKRLQPWWATDFQFMPEGIQVGNAKFPVLRMNWVEGFTLTRWVNEHIGAPSALAGLAQRFDGLVQSMITAHMAHGDLQHGNLLVDDAGNLHLVDYDGMYVPGLDVLASDEIGHPNYQPPGRSQSDYGPAMDRFSAWLISLSLRAIAADSRLWNLLNPDHEEYLLLNKRDFASPNSSPSFSALASHSDAQVRELGMKIRQMLPVPIASMPAPVPGGSAIKTAPRPAEPAARPADRPSGTGIPSWMTGLLDQPAAATVQEEPPPESQEEQKPYNPPTRLLRSFLRVLVVLPLAVLITMIWNPLAGVVSSLSLLVISVVALGIFQQRGSFSREYGEVRHSRELAAAKVRQAKKTVAQIKKDGLSIERDAKKLSGRQAKRREGVRASYGRRQREAMRPQESVDRQLKRLDDRRQRERVRRLRAVQQEYVRAQLAAATIAGSRIPGIGSQLVANLRSVGIRTAADFTRVRIVSNGRTTVAQFQLRRGVFVRVAGIGQVKARQLEQWRRSQVAHATRGQPAVLAPSELASIEARFAPEEQRLRDERTRVAAEIASQLVSIEKELADALVALEKEQAGERDAVDQRRLGSAARLGQAMLVQRGTEQSLHEVREKLAGARRPPLRSFMVSVLRG